MGNIVTDSKLNDKNYITVPGLETTLMSKNYATIPGIETTLVSKNYVTVPGLETILSSKNYASYSSTPMYEIFSLRIIPATYAPSSFVKYQDIKNLTTDAGPYVLNSNYDPKFFSINTDGTFKVSKPFMVVFKIKGHFRHIMKYFSISLIKNGQAINTFTDIPPNRDVVLTGNALMMRPTGYNGIFSLTQDQCIAECDKFKNCAGVQFGVGGHNDGVCVPMTNMETTPSTEVPLAGTTFTRIYSTVNVDTTMSATFAPGDVFGFKTDRTFYSFRGHDNTIEFRISYVNEY